MTRWAGKPSLPNTGSGRPRSSWLWTAVVSTTPRLSWQLRTVSSTPTKARFANNFSGGDQTTSRLRALGFTIAAPSVSPSPVRFGLEDCKLFERYATPVHWNDENISAPDQALFKSIRDRLKELAAWLAGNAPVDVPLHAYTSLYQANGRSQRDIWCCVYPAERPQQVLRATGCLDHLRGRRGGVPVPGSWPVPAQGSSAG